MNCLLWIQHTRAYHRRYQLQAYLDSAPCAIHIILLPPRGCTGCSLYHTPPSARLHSLFCV